MGSLWLALFVAVTLEFVLALDSPILDFDELFGKGNFCFHEFHLLLQLPVSGRDFFELSFRSLVAILPPLVFQGVPIVVLEIFSRPIVGAVIRDVELLGGSIVVFVMCENAFDYFDFFFKRHFSSRGV